MRARRTETPSAPKLDWEIFRTLLPYIWEYRGRSIIAMVLLLLAKVATVSVPLVLKRMVDVLDASSGAILALPLGLLLGYGALRFTASAFEELRAALFARMRYGIMRKISLQVISHLHDLSLRFHLERQTGAITRDINRGASSISNLLNYLLFRIVPTLVEIGLVAAVLLKTYDAWFALVVVVTFTIYVALTLVVTEWRLRHRVAMNKAESRANAHAIDALINYETVKYFGNEAFEVARYDEDLIKWEAAAVRSQSSLSLLNLTQGLVIAVGVTLIMVLAAKGVVAGEMSVGDLVAVNAYLLQVFLPLGFLGTIYSVIKHALSDMERMFELLDREPEVQDIPDAQDLKVELGEVRFEEVEFGYDAERQIIHGLSFRVPAGKKLAIVGPSGAGKSTLARLLYRFYDVDAGTITLDGQDIAKATQRSVRDAIAIVPQDTVLFNDTIFYNIHYANLDATREEVVEAARVAAIHDFIESLPDGYDTVVGERGLKLSGGEKQRVAIARAVLKNPRILIFDEATSSLDSASEQSILSALRDVAAEHTTISIAHRLSTITDSDEILVMDGGRISERGTHAELMVLNGVYTNMWRLQQAEDDSCEASVEPLSP
ncbi:ABCB family ABC transporter ATP-binding protein/permease [Bradymonas sediminis]|uniref:Metal ABC transporter permease n=1 Tax=Bradymonas sediminis TaxID=1548548 RepID=A0A2Z4FIX4_9DELT|nr:ABC transporter ATP-binding protein/permease [Bradymonas sediminis]AWV88892.1 metal ABC transporter permease [Bradymonas sediminis]TDP71897.1 ATP-binding cassette subfamily B protein [Bradymonas sediminis]